MSPAKIRIYLAGKIDKNDWRHSIVPELRWHDATYGHLETESFIYTGPFFQSCDHGCFHGNATHGAMTPTQKQRTVAQQRTFKNCLTGVQSADLVIIYINSSDAYGTLIETGWVQALKKDHVLVFSSSISTKASNEFWFAKMGQPIDISYGVNERQIRSKVFTVIDDYRLQNSCGE